MYPDADFVGSYQTKDAVYFYSSAFDPLNPWSAHAVTIWGVLFPTPEHAYHYRKFSDDNPEVASQLLSAPSPWAVMQIERRYKQLRRPDWEDIKVSVMEEILQAAVMQNVDIQECLLATGDKAIKKNAPTDSFWGIGADGKGQNVMGEIYLHLRDELRTSPKS